MAQFRGRVRRAGTGRPGWGRLALMLLVAFALSSCGDDDDDKSAGGGGTPTAPDYTAAELNAFGWTSFSLGDYTGAAGYFGEALEKSAALHEARLGLGWALAHTGFHAEAGEAFDALIGSGQLVTDARAGLAAALLFTEPARARTEATAVLAADPDYAFSRRETFGFLDLHLIIAEASYALADYAAAQARAEQLEQLAGVPANGLDPEQASTWVVDGVTYSSYPAALAVVIQELAFLMAFHVPGSPA